MTNRRAYDPNRKDQAFGTLRREILAARLKITLDKQLDRDTSLTVQRQAGMKRPPLIRPTYEVHDAHAATRQARGGRTAEPAMPK